jgi:hypothetical protein
MSNNEEVAKEKKAETKMTWRHLFIHLAAMAAVAVVIVFITMSWIRSYTEHGIGVVVPNITNMQEQEAIDKLAQYDLVGVTEGYVYIKGRKVGEVTSQRPHADATVKRGRKVYLTISSGNQPMVNIPNIIDNSSVRQAEAQLIALGFKLTEPEYTSGNVDWVYGVSYKGRELKRGEFVPEGSELTLIVGGGGKSTRVLEDTIGVALDSLGRPIDTLEVATDWAL